jgi:hypothetical protein
MIDKILPRRLSSNSDSKVRGKDEMSDALNVSISHDNRDGDNGNEGVLKPIKSNVDISGIAFEGAGSSTVIGKVADEKNEVLYLFVHCTADNAMGVYAYDPNGYFVGHPLDEVIKLYTTQEFNFDPEGFVKGDLTYVQTKRTYTFSDPNDPFVPTTNKTYEDAPMLFFTDNRNEPRKLNVLRAYYDQTVNQYGLGTKSLKDFITACPKAPAFPITFEFVADESLPYSEFRNINGFQFAYQLVYRDRNVSAMSTISDIAVPPTYITHGASEQPLQLNQHNVCRLTIPIEDMSFEVEKVKILARRGNDGQFFEITELSTDPAALTLLGVVEGTQDILAGNPSGLGIATELTFDFRNDTVNKIVSTDNQTKQFDNLPKRAEAQSIINNRLLYGNYVEGFDEVVTDAVITPVAQERTLDFTNYEIKILPATCVSDETISDFESDGYPSEGTPVDPTLNKNAAFVLDPSDIPSVGISTGDVVNLSFSITPDQNWHVYDSSNSYHQHQQLGDFFGPADSELEDFEIQVPLLNFNKNRWWSNPSDAPTFSNNTGFLPAVCDNDGVGDAKWKPVQGQSFPDTIYGTSAANPLILKGEEVTISIKIRANQPLQRYQITDYIAHLITGDDLDAGTPETAFTVLTNEINNTYSYDLNLQNFQEFNMSDPLAKLITMCGKETMAGDEGSLLGCFIVEKADVEIGFFKDKAYNQELGENRYFGEGSGWDNDDNEAYKRRIGIYIKSVDNVTATTCLRAAVTNSPWKVMKLPLQTSLNVIPIGPFEPIVTVLSSFDKTEPFQSGEVFQFFQGQLEHQGLFFSGENADGKSRFSLMDGKGGPAGGPRKEDGSGDYDTLPVLVNENTQLFGATNFGSAKMNGNLLGANISGTIINNDASETMPLLRDNAFQLGPYQTADIFGYASLALNHSSSGANNVTFFMELLNDEGFRSFKSGASHAFGVVYYDQRGRASNVFPLGTALAPPYYARSNNQYGKINMEVQMNHQAPDFAESFQIVYSGNTSISDFVQYTTAGAFIATEDAAEDNGNIYVSLNHLQGNQNISYTDAGGNRSPEGERDMYTFKEGDILRVISYYTGEDTQSGRVFLNEGYDFEIIDYRELGGTSDNPLYDENNEQDTDSIPHKAKQGSFIVLKNNKNADGFNFEDVLLGTGDVNAQSHNWNKRTVVEIFSPKNVAEEDELFFYETSNVFPIDQHNELITLTDGDVWWRKVPVNMPKFDGVFTSLIGSDESESNFKSYSLETQAFNDNVRRADVTGKGKVKVIVPDSQEVRRTASITFSDKNNSASSVFVLTSFNPVKGHFKDLAVEHGSINYIVDQQDSAFVIQSNKVSSVPVSRNIITTASDDQSLVAASNVLGTIKYYAGDAGCDNNPESVCAIDNNVYFANKSSREVYRFNPSNGVQVISEAGMKSFFRKLFRQVENTGKKVKVVGGYDPDKDEYLLSVYNVGEVIDFNEGESEIPVDDSGIPLQYWGAIGEPLFGAPVEITGLVRSEATSTSSVSIPFSNVSDELVYVKVEPFNDHDLDPLAEWPTQFGNGWKRNPWFESITPAIDEMVPVEPNSTVFFDVVGIANDAPVNAPTAEFQGGVPFLFMLGNEREALPPTSGGPQDRAYSTEARARVFNAEGFEIPNSYFFDTVAINAEIFPETAGPQGLPTDNSQPLAGDINNDGAVGTQDLLTLLQEFGDVGNNSVADIDGDDSVGISDVLEFLSQFGTNSEE